MVWEVFVDEGSASQCVERRGDFNTEQFALGTGWDFAKAKRRAASLGKLEKERLEEI